MSDSRFRPRATSSRERRVIAAARGGDAAAQIRLVADYEPMVQHIARRLFLPGGDREDLAQEARWGVVEAMRTWDGSRGVPFSSFAWLCATREARMAVSSALASKHRVLSAAYPLDVTRGVLDPSNVTGTMELSVEPLVWRDIATLEAEQDPDCDPVAKTLARERLAEILGRV